MQEKADARADHANEANNGLKNDRTRSPWRARQIRNSATAQFFINVKDNAFLNYRAANASG